MNNRLLGLLGLCAKAGKIQSGQFLVLKALENNKAKLVLLASDITYRTRKTIQDKANFKKVPVMEAGLNQEELGRAIGQGNRSTVCIMDEGFMSLIHNSLIHSEQ